MKISLTTRERVALAAIMSRAPWGGSRQLLLAQAAIHEVLELGKFVAKDFEAIGAATNIDLTLYEIPNDAAQALETMLTIAGQTADMALASAGVLKRFDPVSAVKAALTSVPAEKDAPAPA